MKIIDKETGVVLMTNNIPYGSVFLSNKSGKIKKDTVICTWDPFNALIIAEVGGKISFENVEEGITYREETDEQSGFTEMVIVETRDKKKNPIY